MLVNFLMVHGQGTQRIAGFRLIYLVLDLLVLIFYPLSLIVSKDCV